MIEGIPLSLAELAPGSLLVLLVAFFVLCLAKGWIVVKLHYDAVERSRDYWRDIAQKAVDTTHILSQANERNSVASEITVKTMAAMQEIRQEAQQGGGGT